MSSLRPTARAGVLLLFTFLLAGCTNARAFTWPWQKEKVITADARNPVHRIVCMWEPSEGRRPDGMPARGFAGQILFFTRTSSTPVRVEGDVKIYVFDDQGPNGDPTLPISEFDFVRTPEGDAWNRHLTITTLGPAYNVFIPYMRRGQHQARCAVQIRLVADGDAPIFSDVATIVLPGPSESLTDPHVLPAPTRTVSHYVDGPFGLQSVPGSTPPAGTQSVVQTQTPALGTVVKTDRGVSVRSARSPALAPPYDGTATTAASVPPLSDGSGSGMPASEADRLARIEHMLAQLAAQQRGPGAPGGAAYAGHAAAEQPLSLAGFESGSGSPTSGYALQAAATAGSGMQPAATNVAFPAATAPAETQSWDVPPAPGSAAAPYAASPAVPEPRRLDQMRLDRTARRLPPRPSWFDQAGRGEAPASGSHHPLRRTDAG